MNRTLTDSSRELVPCAGPLEIRSKNRVVRETSAILAAISCAFQAGCGGLAPAAPNIGHQDALETVAVVATLHEPEIRFEGFAHGKADGAARGAGATFAACASPMLAQGCSAGPFCGVAVIITLGVCGALGAVGGVAGAAAAPAAEAVESRAATLVSALDRRTIQESLREQLSAAIRGSGIAQAVTPESASTVIETTLTKVGTRLPGIFHPGGGGLGIDQPLLLYMQANVRRVRVSDNTTLSSTEHIYLGPRLKLADWSANGGAPLLSALQRGYESLASHIYDGVFRLYRFSDQEPQWTAFMLPVYGLAPVSPATRGALSSDSIVAPFLSWTAVRSLQPTLEWEAFPRKADLAKAADEMARVKNVRYELIIAREQNLAPAEIVYRRSNLSSPVHAVETALQPHTRYFWTVRASFELDGRERVTRWGSTHFGAREEHTAPSYFSYRFRTLRGS